MIGPGEYQLTEQQKKQVRKYIRSLITAEPKPYESCPFYEKCEVQVCPMDPMRDSRIWYADEEPCHNPDFKDHKAVINQKKLSKRHAPGYFTHAMLNRDIVVKIGIQGIDPDIPDTVEKRGQEAIDSLYAERERAWQHGHPELTAEQREKMRTKGMAGLEALKRYREGRTDASPQVDFQEKK